MMREHESRDRHDDSKPSDLIIDEGETVEILETSGPWIKNATADGHDGWIPASAVRQRAE